MARILADSGRAAIDVAPMADLDDFDRTLRIIDRVDDSVMTLPNAEERTDPRELLTSCRAWLGSE